MTTARLTILDSGTLYANPYPGDWAIHAYYSRIVELRANELLAVYRRAAAIYADDGRSFLLRSMDNGKSWQDEGVVYDGAADVKKYSYSATNVVRVNNGELVLTGARFCRPRPDVPKYNDQTGGLLQEEPVLFRSFDDGHTWSPPQLIQTPPGPCLGIYDGVLVLRDGRWLITFDREKPWDDPEPLHPYIVGLISADQGKTWDKQVAIAGAQDCAQTFWHARAISLADGRLITFPWTGDSTGTNFLTLHRVVGDPDGQHWGKPQPTSIQGQTNRPVDLGEGYLALVVSIRESKAPGIYMALSADEGRTWDTDHLLQVWDAYGQDSIGVPRTDTYPASHDNIAFGAPDVIRLSDGDLMASYWASQMGLMTCRWCRLRFDR